MRLGGLGGLSAHWLSRLRKNPLVTKVKALDGDGIMAGDEHETREKSDYSEKKRVQASVSGYDKKGKPVKAENDEPHEGLDEIG